jgi:hypothetical protein
MPKKEKRLTRKERQAAFGKGPSGVAKANPSAKAQHIHCISCGRHLEPEQFSGLPASAAWLTCQHGSQFAACLACTADAQARLDEHDRSGEAPRIAAVWH